MAGRAFKHLCIPEVQVGIAVRLADASVNARLAQQTVEAWAIWALAEGDRIDPIRSGRFFSQFGLMKLSDP
jgi:hypothetical protein